MRLGHVRWHLGYPEQALKRIHEGLTLARELTHPQTLAPALMFAGLLHRLRREVGVTKERAEALIALANEQGFPFFLAAGIMLHGWVLTEEGQGEEGVARIRQSLTVHRAAGGGAAARSLYPVVLAEACCRVGKVEEGLNVLLAPFATKYESDRLYGAELYRLKGELTLKQFGVRGSGSGVTSTQHLAHNPQAEAEAEACFLKAIEIARRQQAKSLELRATMSLARLWQQQGKKEEAQRMLAEIYGWFTEGFDTADLQEAKALLEELQ